MKNEKQQQAKNLYFQTNLNKTEIAEMLGINRRTVMLWVQQGNWDRLKMAGQHLPSMVAEKCYYVLNHYLDNLLSSNNTISTFGTKEASAINSLASSIKKIRTRSAVNESMEMMSFFLDDVRRKDPNMAEAIKPFIEQYIVTRADVNTFEFLPQGFNDQGFLEVSEEEIKESWLDEQEQQKIDQDFAAWKAKKVEARLEASDLGNGKPAEPIRPGFTPPAHHDLPPVVSMSNDKSHQQVRKLTHELEKQLTEHLKNQNSSKVAA